MLTHAGDAELDGEVTLGRQPLARWRAVNAPHLVALVRAGARFERGLLVKQPEVTAA